MKIRRKRILELLVIKKMSQAELARILGTTPSFVTHVLNGRKKLSFKKGKLLIELFGAD